MVGLKFSKKNSLVFKLFKLYLFDMSIIFAINFDTIFFLISWFERREKNC
jgi:hypothetical protein